MRVGQLDLLNLPMPITLKPGSPITDEELMRFSEQNKPYKIERNQQGELTIRTPVGGIGSTHEKYVTMMFGIWSEQDGTGIDFSPSVGFNLPDGSCLSPDASWVSLERWNKLNLRQQGAFPPLCPDFVIEVRSQSDSRRVVEAKMQTWLDNGATLAWLIDPIDGNVTIYSRGQSAITHERPETIVATAPVDGFELRCNRLWSAR